MTEQLIPESKENMPPGLQLEKVDDRIMTLNVGPQHPGSGHMRLIVKIDGRSKKLCIKHSTLRAPSNP